MSEEISSKSLSRMENEKNVLLTRQINLIKYIVLLKFLCGVLS